MALGKELSAKKLWQRILCREPRGRLSTKTLPRARNALSKAYGAVEKRQYWRRLCRELCWQALGKDFLFFILKKSLCREPARLALGKGGLCREPSWQALGKAVIFVNSFLSLPSAGHPSSRQSWDFFCFFVFSLFFTYTATYVYIYHKSTCLYHNPRI